MSQRLESGARHAAKRNDGPLCLTGMVGKMEGPLARLAGVTACRKDRRYKQKLRARPFRRPHFPQRMDRGGHRTLMAAMAAICAPRSGKANWPGEQQHMAIASGDHLNGLKQRPPFCLRCRIMAKDDARTFGQGPHGVHQARA